MAFPVELTNCMGNGMLASRYGPWQDSAGDIYVVGDDNSSAGLRMFRCAAGSDPSNAANWSSVTSTASPVGNSSYHIDGIQNGDKIHLAVLTYSSVTKAYYLNYDMGTDSFSSWVLVDTPAVTSGTCAIAHDGTNTNLWAAFPSATSYTSKGKTYSRIDLWKSTNSGATWSKVDTGGTWCRTGATATDTSGGCVLFYTNGRLYTFFNLISTASNSTKMLARSAVSGTIYPSSSTFTDTGYLTYSSGQPTWPPSYISQLWLDGTTVRLYYVAAAFYARELSFTEADNPTTFTDTATDGATRILLAGSTAPLQNHFMVGGAAVLARNGNFYGSIVNGTNNDVYYPTRTPAGTWTFTAAAVGTFYLVSANVIVRSGSYKWAYVYTLATDMAVWNYDEVDLGTVKSLASRHSRTAALVAAFSG